MNEELPPIQILEEKLRAADDKIATLRETEGNGKTQAARKKWNEDWRKTWQARAELSEQLATLTPLAPSAALREASVTLARCAGELRRLANEHYKGDVEKSREADALQAVADVLSYADQDELLSLYFAAQRKQRAELEQKLAKLTG